MGWREIIEENGFAIIPGVFSHDYVDRLLQDISALAPRRSRAGVRNAMGLPPVAAAAQESQMIELAGSVLGPNAFPFRATLFDKSPTANWLVAWHQGTALPLQRRVELPGWWPGSVKEGIACAHAPATALTQVLTQRLSCDASNAENGPLRVLPRTHAVGVLSDDNIHDLATQIPLVECVVPKGGVVAMRPLLIHSSNKSHTEVPRRVLHIEYAASPSIATPLELAIA